MPDNQKFRTRLFFFSALVAGSFNFLGQSLSFTFVKGYFGVTAQDASWLLRGFQSGTIITGIAGLVFIKWLGQKTLFISSVAGFLIATYISSTATTFNILLVSRMAAGIANGFIIAVATQMFLSTFEGKNRIIGSLYTVAANIGGLCLGILCNSLFTEDYGWQFNYFLSVPVLTALLALAFVIMPSSRNNEDIEEDWISIIPFSILIVALFFVVLFREQYQGFHHPKILIATIIAIVAAALLLIRGITHSKPLFDTRLLQYPEFVVALLISYLAGAAFVFNVSIIAKLLGGILQMPMADVFHFINFLFLVVFAMLIATFILIVKKFNAHWLMITGLLAIAFAAFSLSKLNPGFSFQHIIQPSMVGIAGAGIVATSVIIIAVKSVPQHQISKVANFRSVAFTLGIALTATDLGRILNFESTRNFNLMVSHTDPGNPLVRERLNMLQSLYKSNGLDADQSYQAAVNGLTGMVNLQSFFLSMSETLMVGCLFCMALALVLFILWSTRNYKSIINFFNINTRKKK